MPKRKFDLYPVKQRVLWKFWQKTIGTRASWAMVALCPGMDESGGVVKAFLTWADEETLWAKCCLDSTHQIRKTTENHMEAVKACFFNLRGQREAVCPSISSISSISHVSPVRQRSWPDLHWCCNQSDAGDSKIFQPDPLFSHHFFLIQDRLSGAPACPTECASISLGQVRSLTGRASGWFMQEKKTRSFPLVTRGYSMAINTGCFP